MGNISKNKSFANVALTLLLICAAGYWFQSKSSNHIAVGTGVSTSSPAASVASTNKRRPAKKAKRANAAPAVPKPRAYSRTSDLPFYPAGCPYVFVKGSDSRAMINNKSITTKIYGRDYTFTIGHDHPNGVRALVIADRYGEDLFHHIDFSDDDAETFFDEFGDLNSDCSMQLTVMDFNNDNECEILFTIKSDETSTATTYVFKLLPHPYQELLVKYLGSAWGQQQMFIDETTIIAPYGSQGLSEEYMLAPNGRIININN